MVADFLDVEKCLSIAVHFTAVVSEQYWLFHSHGLHFTPRSRELSEQLSVCRASEQLLALQGRVGGTSVI